LKIDKGYDILYVSAHKSYSIGKICWRWAEFVRDFRTAISLHDRICLQILCILCWRKGDIWYGEDWKELVWENQVSPEL